MNAHSVFFDRSGAPLCKFTRLDDLPVLAARLGVAVYAKVLGVDGPLPAGVLRADSSTFYALP